MRFRVSLLIVCFFVAGNVLLACGGSSGSKDKEFVISSDLVITEKTLPANFYELAEHGVLAKKVTNEDEFTKQWEYFGLKESVPEIDWHTKAVIFLGVFESGSCPLEFKHVELNAEKTDLIYYLETASKDRACTDDATPRTFVIAVDAAKVSNVTFVEIHNYHGINPRVELANDGDLNTSDEVIEGDFIYRLVTEKEEYDEFDSISIYAELEYIGDMEEVTIYHAASPFYFPIVEKTRGYSIDYPMDQPLLSTTLTKGKLIYEQYTNSGGYSSQDDKDFVEFMSDFLNEGFPTGDYVVNGFAHFYIESSEQENENYNMKAQIDFNVKTN